MNAKPDSALLNFEAYDSLFNSINLQQPQRQGLLPDEYHEAFERVDTAFAEVESELGRVAVPQLVSIDVYEWLNKDYYSAKFPKETESGDIYHLAYQPRLHLSPMTRNHLGRLADANGVLTFDYPAIASDHKDVILDSIRANGVEISEVYSLGTQTYHAGVTTLNNGIDPKKTAKSFKDTYDELVTNKSLNQYVESGTSLERVIDVQEAERFYQFFSAAYDSISFHPCSQALTPKEFQQMLANPDIAKIVYRNEGEAETICLITEDLSQLSWVNQDFYDFTYPNYAKNNQIVWFPGIATDPDPAKIGHNVPKVVSLIAKLGAAGNNAPLIVFDTPDVNTGFLDRYLQDEINKTRDAKIDFIRIGQQIYEAYRLQQQ